MASSIRNRSAELNVESPGAMTRYRFAIEHALTTRAETQLREFLATTKRSVLSAYRSGHPMPSPVWYEDNWHSVMVEPLVNYLAQTDTEKTQITAMLAADDTPGRVAESVSSVLLVARQNSMTDEELSAALSDALHPDSAPTEIVAAGLSLVTAGWRWASTVTGISTLVSTAMTGYRALRKMRELSKHGKQWVSMHDNKVREAHAAADGQIQPLEMPFLVGGELLLMPGDPDGSPAMTYNCRCVLVAAGE